MKKSIAMASLIFLSLPALAMARDGTMSAAAAWGNNAYFQSSYDIMTKAAIAELMAKKENGYYDGWDQNTTYITNIGAQTTTIGAQTIFQDSELSNVFVSTTSCGEITSVTTVDSSDQNTITANGASCEVKTKNAKNP